VKFNGLMVFPSLRNHFSREFMLDKISYIGRGFGMIAYRKRIRRIVRVTSREVVMRNWTILVRQEREKERVIEIRVTMMEDHLI
jgi:hypothetical protein